MIAGTIRNAVNQMQLVNDWEQKKATGDVVKKQEVNCPLCQGHFELV